MDCKKANALLSEWIDGRLAGPVGRALTQHLGECGACRKDEEDLRKSWELLKLYPSVEPSPALLAKVLSRMRRPLVWKIVAPALAAAAAVAISIAVFLAPPKPNPQSPATDEERELVENLELLENYETLTTLEVVADESASPDGRVILEREDHR